MHHSSGLFLKWILFMGLIWTVKQDDAAIHMSQLTIQYLFQYCRNLKDWSASSPDLNIMKYLWSILKSQVEQREPKNKEEFLTVCVWSLGRFETKANTKFAIEPWKWDDYTSHKFQYIYRREKKYQIFLTILFLRTSI